MKYLLLPFLCLSFWMPLTAQYAQVGPVFTGNFAMGDFGDDVAISGDGRTIAIGDPLAGDNNTGSVTVYRRDGDTWRRIGTPIEGISPNALYGRAVALDEDGDRLVFATSERIGFGGNQSTSFATPVYEVSDTELTQLTTIFVLPEATTFGEDLAISDDGARVFVGAPNVSSNGGRAHLFDLNPTTGSYDLTQTIQQTSAGRFGFRVSMSGDGAVLAVTDADGQQRNGEVSLYRFDATTDQFTRRITFVSGEPATENGFGMSLDRTGDHLITGAYRQRTGSAIDGVVRGYKYDGQTYSTWFDQLSAPALDGDGFGSFGVTLALSADASTFAVGISGFSNTFRGQGAVLVYKVDAVGTPVLQTPLLAGPEEFFGLGNDVDISDNGESIIAGADVAGGMGAAIVLEDASNPVGLATPTLELPDLRVAHTGGVLRLGYGRDFGTQPVQHRLVDMEGRTLQRWTGRGTGSSVRTPALATGVYVVMVAVEGKGLARRVFVR